uniref:Bm1109 n=1 Tax=Brugia malayi TaxID=6279 RepID=A0A0H5SDW0_BRUMA|nr:Bm1109 [Brugia malayi]
MAIVCFSRGNLYGRAFILITLQIIICNLISFIPHIIVLLPEILLTKNSLYTCKTWINHLFSTINTSSFYAVLHFGFLWTLNRFLSIIFPKCNAFFESTKLYFLIIFVWLTAFAISFADYYYCSRSFEVSTLLWTANCTKQSSNSGKVFLSFRHIWALFLSIAMLAMYFAIFCNIRHRRVSVTNEPRRILAMNTRHGTSRLETAKYERSVLIQAALTCGRTVLPITLFATNKHARKYVYLFLKVDRVGTVRFRTILTNKVTK